MFYFYLLEILTLRTMLRTNNEARIPKSTISVKNLIVKHQCHLPKVVVGLPRLSFVDNAKLETIFENAIDFAIFLQKICSNILNLAFLKTA